MLNSNGVREIQHYAFNGSSVEEVYVILIYGNINKKKGSK